MHKRTLAGTLSAVMITGALSALSVGSAEAATQSTVAVDAATLAGGATSTAGLFSAKETDYANTGSSAFVAGPDGATAPGSLELRTEATHSGSQNDKIYAGKTLLDVPVGPLDPLAYTVRTAPANNDATAPYLQMYVQDATPRSPRSSSTRTTRPAGRARSVPRAPGRRTTPQADNAQWRNTRTLDGHAAGTYMTLAQWAADDSSLVTHPGFGAVVVVAGQTSEDASWSNYRAQLDQLVVGISGDTTTYDFGTALGDCATNTDLATETATLTADCTTATTLSVPDGWTIDGNGHKVIATETAGSSFSGAVLQNAGTSMHVRDLTVETTAAGPAMARTPAATWRASASKTPTARSTTSPCPASRTATVSRRATLSTSTTRRRDPAGRDGRRHHRVELPEDRRAGQRQREARPVRL